ncbi:MAG: hypothetical protein K0R94_146, partial [Burkholderiales bacterium]|nr:hypothetical protein [Burkholderiales bacterium]
MKSFIRILILFFCAVTAGANVHCFSYKCKMMLEQRHKPQNLSIKLMNDGAVYTLANKNGKVYAGTFAGKVWEN